MENKSKKEILSPEKAHSQEVLIQIFLPFLLVIVLCLGVFIFAVVGTNTDFSTTEKWSEISTIFLILPAILIGMVLLVVMILTLILVVRGNKNLPLPIRKIRKSIIGFNQKIQKVGSAIANPIIKGKSLLAGINHLFKHH